MDLPKTYFHRYNLELEGRLADEVDNLVSQFSYLVSEEDLKGSSREKEKRWKEYKEEVAVLYSRLTEVDMSNAPELECARDRLRTVLELLSGHNIFEGFDADAYKQRVSAMSPQEREKELELLLALKRSGMVDTEHLDAALGIIPELDPGKRRKRVKPVDGIQSMRAALRHSLPLPEETYTKNATPKKIDLARSKRIEAEKEHATAVFKRDPIALLRLYLEVISDDFRVLPADSINHKDHAQLSADLAEKIFSSYFTLLKDEVDAFRFTGSSQNLGMMERLLAFDPNLFLNRHHKGVSLLQEMYLKRWLKKMESQSSSMMRERVDLGSLSSVKLSHMRKSGDLLLAEVRAMKQKAGSMLNSEEITELQKLEAEIGRYQQRITPHLEKAKSREKAEEREEESRFRRRVGDFLSRFGDQAYSLGEDGKNFALQEIRFFQSISFYQNLTDKQRSKLEALKNDLEERDDILNNQFVSFLLAIVRVSSPGDLEKIESKLEDFLNSAPGRVKREHARDIQQLRENLTVRGRELRGALLTEGHREPSGFEPPPIDLLPADSPIERGETPPPPPTASGDGKPPRNRGSKVTLGLGPRIPQVPEPLAATSQSLDTIDASIDPNWFPKQKEPGGKYRFLSDDSAEELDFLMQSLRKNPRIASEWLKDIPLNPKALNPLQRKNYLFRLKVLSDFQNETESLDQQQKEELQEKLHYYVSQENDLDRESPWKRHDDDLLKRLGTAEASSSERVGLKEQREKDDETSAQKADTEQKPGEGERPILSQDLPGTAPGPEGEKVSSSEPEASDRDTAANLMKGMQVTLQKKSLSEDEREALQLQVSALLEYLSKLDFSEEESAEMKKTITQAQSLLQKKEGTGESGEKEQGESTDTSDHTPKVSDASLEALRRGARIALETEADHPLTRRWIYGPRLGDLRGKTRSEHKNSVAKAEDALQSLSSYQAKMPDGTAKAQFAVILEIWNQEIIDQKESDTKIKGRKILEISPSLRDTEVEMIWSVHVRNMADLLKAVQKGDDKKVRAIVERITGARETLSEASKVDHESVQERKDAFIQGLSDKKEALQTELSAEGSDETYQIRAKEIQAEMDKAFYRLDKKVKDATEKAPNDPVEQFYTSYLDLEVIISAEESALGAYHDARVSLEEAKLKLEKRQSSPWSQAAVIGGVTVVAAAGIWWAVKKLRGAESKESPGESGQGGNVLSSLLQNFSLADVFVGVAGGLLAANSSLSSSAPAELRNLSESVKSQQSQALKKNWTLKGLVKKILRSSPKDPKLEEQEQTLEKALKDWQAADAQWERDATTGTVERVADTYESAIQSLGVMRGQLEQLLSSNPKDLSYSTIGVIISGLAGKKKLISKSLQTLQSLESYSPAARKLYEKITQGKMNRKIDVLISESLQRAVFLALDSGRGGPDGAYTAVQIARLLHIQDLDSISNALHDLSSGGLLQKDPVKSRFPEQATYRSNGSDYPGRELSHLSSELLPSQSAEVLNRRYEDLASQITSFPEKMQSLAPHLQALYVVHQKAAKAYLLDSESYIGVSQERRREIYLDNAEYYLRELQKYTTFQSEDFSASQSRNGRVNEETESERASRTRTSKPQPPEVVRAEDATTGQPLEATEVPLPPQQKQAA